MVIAELQEKADTDPNQDGTYTHRYNFAYYGPEVPGGILFREVSITVLPNVVLSTVPGLIAAAARQVATNSGFTVTANKVLLPQYQAL